MCSGGKCVRKGIGASCNYTHNCESNACRNGKCIKPMFNGSACEDDWHCATRNCFDWKCQNKRNLLQSCDRSKQCIPGADCLNYFGSRGKCKYHWDSRTEGERCTEDKECKEGTCTSGKCVVKTLGQSCRSNKECKTGKCYDWVCALDDYSQGRGDKCARTKDCGNNLSCVTSNKKYELIGYKMYRKGTSKVTRNINTGTCQTVPDGWWCGQNDAKCSGNVCIFEKCASKKSLNERCGSGSCAHTQS